MPRIRKITKHGNSYVLSLSISDIKDFNIEIGDEFDAETMLVTGKVKHKKKVKKV